MSKRKRDSTAPGKLLCSYNCHYQGESIIYSFFLANNLSGKTARVCAHMHIPTNYTKCYEGYNWRIQPILENEAILENLKKEKLRQ